RHLVGARVQVQKSELTLTVGYRRPRCAADGCGGERHIDAWQDAALFIGNRSVNIAGRDLRAGSRYGPQREGQYQDNHSFHGWHSFLMAIEHRSTVLQLSASGAGRDLAIRLSKHVLMKALSSWIDVRVRDGFAGIAQCSHRGGVFEGRASHCRTRAMSRASSAAGAVRT